MGRESAHDKGRRLLTEGRLSVAYVKPSDQRVRALCRGDSGELYRLGYDPVRSWWCECKARSACSHLVALRLIVLAPGAEDHPF